MIAAADRASLAGLLHVLLQEAHHCMGDCADCSTTPFFARLEAVLDAINETSPERESDGS